MKHFHKRNTYVIICKYARIVVFIWIQQFNAIAKWSVRFYTEISRIPDSLYNHKICRSLFFFVLFFLQLILYLKELELEEGHRLSKKDLNWIGFDRGKPKRNQKKNILWLSLLFKSPVISSPMCNCCGKSEAEHWTLGSTYYANKSIWKNYIIMYNQARVTNSMVMWWLKFCVASFCTNLNSIRLRYDTQCLLEVVIHRGVVFQANAFKSKWTRINYLSRQLSRYRAIKTSEIDDNLNIQRMKYPHSL